MARSDMAAAIVGVGILVLFGLVLLMFRKKPAPKPVSDETKPKSFAELERDAQQALTDGKLELARELYIAAQKPGRAALVAVRENRHDAAAELFEKDGQIDKAATHYRKAGLLDKASELEERLARVSDPNQLASGILTPEQRAEADERVFRTALDEQRTKGGDASVMLLKAELAAKAWTTLGNVKRAAEIYRDAGLVDRAVELYSQGLLDLPEAARVASLAGDHLRAARLFEQAGQREQAIKEWIQWTRSAVDPLAHVIEIKSLGAAAVTQIFKDVATQRRVDADNPVLHYRIAVTLEEMDELKAALACFKQVHMFAPQYTDTLARINGLNVRIANADASRRASLAPGSRPIDPEQFRTSRGPVSKSSWEPSGSSDLAPGKATSTNSGVAKFLKPSRAPEPKTEPSSLTPPLASGNVFGGTKSPPDAFPALPGLGAIKKISKNEFPALPARPEAPPTTDAPQPVSTPSAAPAAAALPRASTGPSSADAAPVTSKQLSAPPRTSRASLEPVAAPVNSKQLSTPPRTSRASLEPVAAPVNSKQLSAPPRTSRASLEPVAAPVNSKQLSTPPAKVSPSSAELELLLAASPHPGPCLANIELYYRIAKAYLAEQKLGQGRACLRTVAEVSPAYRDVESLLAGLEEPGAKPAADATGSSAQRYALIKEIGRGRRAIVYQAHDAQLDREVALKLFIDEPSGTATFLDHFEAHARVAASLNHLHAVRIWDLGVLDNRLFVALEPVEGRSLESILAETGPLDVREAVDIAVQVLNVLEYAHERNIVHRDLRLSNVMKTAAGPIKVMDARFGKSVDRPLVNSSAVKLASCTALEQLEDQKLDGRTDLFAVGAMLYEMLAGKPAYPGLDRSTPPVALSTLRPEIPEALAGAVQRALSTRDERFESAADMRRALREAMADQSLSFARRASIAPQTTSRPLLSEPPRRSRPAVIEETVISRSSKDNR